MIVSSHHRILAPSRIALRMSAAREGPVAVKQLLEIEGISIAEDLTTIEYVHLLSDRHEIVISNGAETKSLFAGPMTRKAVGQAARQEIKTLFPELASLDHVSTPARHLPTGKEARKMAGRHVSSNRVLVM